jgi:hypothetical protein
MLPAVVITGHNGLSVTRSVIYDDHCVTHNTEQIHTPLTEVHNGRESSYFLIIFYSRANGHRVPITGLFIIQFNTICTIVPSC